MNLICTNSKVDGTIGMNMHAWPSLADGLLDPDHATSLPRVISPDQGYGWIEFRHEEVAKIVAETMNKCPSSYQQMMKVCSKCEKGSFPGSILRDVRDSGLNSLDSRDILLRLHMSYHLATCNKRCQPTLPLGSRPS